MGSRQYGIDNDRLVEYAKEIKKVVDAGVELAIVIGGGNIFRGVAGQPKVWMSARRLYGNVGYRN